MKPIFPNVAILGLGLIGGSLALDLKRLGLAKRVMGYNRSPDSRREALRRRACDAVFSDPVEAVQDADLVVLAVPVRTIPALAKKIAPHLKKGAVITDVGSTKAALNAKVRRVLPKRAVWIGGHPIAGSEHTGMASALSGLFRGRWWILTPEGRGEAQTAAKLARLLKALGAKVQSMPATEHDRILATSSHLPHLLAFSLVQLASKKNRRRALKFSGTSFRDGTRVAASSAEMWVDICLDNRRALLAALADYEKLLKALGRDIRGARAGALRRYFDSAARVRRKL
ncbi:MAG TPA: prephenate dehydrogenase/arogenate dehydrogenase family protein [bacterium]|nr:prephenate dehydrogenase/arogenate dehydrogenase family protein [bacterium]